MLTCSIDPAKITCHNGALLWFFALVPASKLIAIACMGHMFFLNYP